jgi:ribosomal protein L44E
MGTKQHKTFCPACGKTTNHVTNYQKADDGGPLVATVRCAEHSEMPACV